MSFNSFTTLSDANGPAFPTEGFDPGSTSAVRLLGNPCRPQSASDSGPVSASLDLGFTYELRITRTLASLMPGTLWMPFGASNDSRVTQPSFPGSRPDSQLGRVRNRRVGAFESQPLFVLSQFQSPGAFPGFWSIPGGGSGLPPGPTMRESERAMSRSSTARAAGIPSGVFR